MGYNPILERLYCLHCGQWDQYRKRHHSVYSTLTLMLDVNWPKGREGQLSWHGVSKVNEVQYNLQQTSKFCFPSLLMLSISHGL